jgi:hypothetical protein
MFECRDDHAATVGELLAASPTELLDQLEGERPGVWMLSVLDHLREEVLSDQERERVLGCWDRFSGWVALRRAEAMVDAATGQEQVAGPFGVDDFGQEVVALVTGQSLHGAANELVTARTVVRDLPGCVSALERGEITWAMARAVVDATAGSPAWIRTQVDQAMVNRWEIDRDLPTWRRKLRREVLKADLEAEARRQRAIKGRRVESWPLPDGMAAVYAELSAQDARSVIVGLSRIAEQYESADRARVLTGARSEARTADQRRADALVDLCSNLPAGDDELTPAGRRQVHVQVTGGILTLLGLRDDPGELAGYGPITAEHLRELAADGEWRRFLTAEDTGALIAIGQAAYRPNASLRRFLQGATPACDFPGCSIPSARCDGEHTIPHDDGGATNEHNVCPRCRRHHRCKTHADWIVRTRPNEYVEWITPAGTSRIIAPHRLAADDADGSADDRSADQLSRL